MNSNQLQRRKIVVLENGLISTYTMREALMKELLEQGYEVYVLTHTNQFQQEVEKTGLKVIDVGSANTSVLKIGGYIRRIYRAMKEIKPDLCLTFSVRPAVWGNFVARRLGVPVITNISGIGPLFESKNVAYRILRNIYPVALRRTARVFFQNKEDLQIFLQRKYVREEQTGWIPGSGVDLEKFRPSAEGTKAKRFTFLFIGRLIKDKGIGEFVEAARQVKEKNPDVTFRVIGPLWHQNLKSNLLSQNQLDQWVADGTIEYLGEKKDVRPYIATSDCIVLPSYREGTSNVLLEAAAMEKPCIASNVTGCREVIDDGVTGMLCRVRDASDLAQKINEMAALPETVRSEMGARARMKVAVEFNKQIVLDSYLAEINRLLAQPAKYLSMSRLVQADFNATTALAGTNAV